MGTVYRARAADGSVVAVKLLHFHLGEVEEFVKRFHREALLAAKLAHPNVVRVLADGEEGGQHYLVMELVEGKTLTELMHEAGIATAGVKSSESGKRGSAPKPRRGSSLPRTPTSAPAAADTADRLRHVRRRPHR
jgi:serine/threonine protein kinase